MWMDFECSATSRFGVNTALKVNVNMVLYRTIVCVLLSSSTIALGANSNQVVQAVEDRLFEPRDIVANTKGYIRAKVNEVAVSELTGQSEDSMRASTAGLPLNMTIPSPSLGETASSYASDHLMARDRRARSRHNADSGRSSGDSFRGSGWLSTGTREAGEGGVARYSQGKPVREGHQGVLQSRMLMQDPGDSDKRRRR